MADWPKEALKAASALWLGAPKSHAASAAGITSAQLRTWMQSDWWPDCVRQAEAQHFTVLLGTARKVLKTTMEAGLHEEATARDRKQALDAARFLLERRDNAFAPPGVSHQHTHRLEAVPMDQLSVEELRALAAGKQLPSRPPAQLEDAEFEDIIEMDEQRRPNRPPSIQEAEDGRLILDDE